MKKYDPAIALDGGKDGLSAYKSIIPRIKKAAIKFGTTPINERVIFLKR